MSYENIVQKLQKDEVVLLDGGTGTELQSKPLSVPGTKVVRKTFWSPGRFPI